MPRHASHGTRHRRSSHRHPTRHSRHRVVPHSRRHRRRHARNDEYESSVYSDDINELDYAYDCPKFFEETHTGCEKPLSLWRGNGQKKKCRNCQECGNKWFPICPPSFVATECDICAPVCPDGTIDHEGVCIKPGLDVIEKCHPNEELIDGDCYRKCPGQTSEYSILCFGLCPADMIKCGHTLCIKPD